MPAPAGPPPTRSAFTLVELVIVLAIIVIAAMVAAPRYANAVQHYRLDAAAKRVAADLEYAATYAKAQSAAQTVTFDVTGCAYSSAVPRADRRGGGISVSLTAEPYKVLIVSADFAGSKTATFDGFGIPAAGGSVVVAAGKESRRITLASSTGKATITSEWIP